jgi:hypothetical protein
MDKFAIVQVFVVLASGTVVDGADCGLWVVETLKQWATCDGCCDQLLPS